MGTQGRRRRRRRTRKDKVPVGPTCVHDIPDHLLELVLLRVGSSLALLRAAFTCKRWRRIVADPGFLSRFRSLHAPRVAGHYHAADHRYVKSPSTDGNHPVFLPASSPDALERRHFSLDFLPDSGGSWELADSRGAILLLYKKRTNDVFGLRRRLYFPDLVVCEPLSRRYQGILYPAEMHTYLCLGVFLLDGDADETGGCIGMSNFRVVSVLYEHDMWQYDHGAPLLCVFSAGSDGGWSVRQGTAGGDILLPTFDSISFAGRALRSLYWAMERGDAVLALDKTTLEFSVITFPEAVGGSYDRSNFRVIAGEDGAVRVVRLMDNLLTVFAQLQGSGEWVVEKLVRLPEATRGLPGRKQSYFLRPAMIVAANERYILVTPQEKKTWVFSVELETLEVERAHERNKYAGPAYPYELPWPPALQACTADHQRCRRRR